MAKKVTLVPPEPRCSDNPKFMSSRHVEYKVVKTELGFWKIVMYKGGFTPKPLKGHFTRYDLAEKVLIAWLKKTDKFREAIYPGCVRKQQNSTGRSSKA
jgi:hypothetical protein